MKKLNSEITHSQKIFSRAEFIWGWSTPSGQIRANRRGEMYVNFGQIKKNQKVLEIGCGTGIFTEKLSKTGAQITAVDISPYFIKKAKKKVDAENVKFIVDDVEHLNFSDNSFDCVVGSSILHHLLNLENGLLEIKRVLKKNGKIVFTEPNMMNPQIMLVKKIKLLGKLMGDSPTETAFFRWRLKQLLRKVGFKSVSVRPFDFLHPWIPNFLVKQMMPIGIIFEKTPLIQEIAGSLLIYAEK